MLLSIEGNMIRSSRLSVTCKYEKIIRVSFSLRHRGVWNITRESERDILHDAAELFIPSSGYDRLFSW